MAHELGLMDLRYGKWHIVAASVMSAVGLEEGLHWLIASIKLDKKAYSKRAMNALRLGA